MRKVRFRPILPGENGDPVPNGDLSRFENLGIDPGPAGVAVLEHSDDGATGKRSGDIAAGFGVIGDFDFECFADCQSKSRLDLVPVETGQGQILAGGARYDRMALSLEGHDSLEGIKTECPVRAPVVFEVSLTVSLGACWLDANSPDRQLGYATVGDVDLKHVGLVCTGSSRFIHA